MKVISIIPARGGSKGIKKKNIINLGGKPLIHYTIQAAKKSKRVERIFVSTEDDEIANISKKYGVEVLKRPIELAGDDISNMKVIFEVLRKLHNKLNNSTIVILLQPTSPLRTNEDIDQAILEFQRSNCESLISVCKASHPPQWSLKIENGYLKAFFNEDYLFARRQDLEKAYIPNGAIFIATKETIEKTGTYYCEKIKPYIMPFERSVDIDNEFDLKLAEFLIKKKNEKY